MTNINQTIFWAFNDLAGRSAFGDFVIIFFENYLAYILILVFLILLFVWKLPRLEKIACAVSAIVAGILSRGVIVESIRFFYHHPRPFVALSDVHQLFPESGYSFPSGHATFFFALSAVVYRYNKTAGTTFFILSGIMGLARITAGVHYPFDIVGGAILGTLAGFISVTLVRHYFFPKRKTDSSTS